MDVIVYLLLLFMSGLIVGALARLAIPGPDPMGIFQTAMIGIAGSFLAGLVLWAVTGDREAWSFILSVIFAAFFVYLVRRSRGGSFRDPGTYPGRRP